MVVPETTGLLVPAKSPPDLAAAIGRLIRDSPLRSTMGAAGRQRASTVFSLEAHARRLSDIYGELTDTTSAPVSISTP